MNSSNATDLDSSKEPGSSRRRYAILGDGRAARHILHYLKLAGAETAQWSRRLERETGVRLSGIIESADAVLILVSDSAIGPLLEANPQLRSRPLLHASGSQVVPGVLGAHPLMSFGPELHSLEEYRRMAFVLDGPTAEFHRRVPELSGNPAYEIQPEEKAKYHALCVLAGNFTTLLWQKAFEEFEGSLGIPRNAVLPYLKRIAANLAGDPSQALTGPLARGDQSTLDRNLKALEGDPYARVYEAFVRAYRENASRRSEA